MVYNTFIIIIEGVNKQKLLLRDLSVGEGLGAQPQSGNNGEKIVPYFWMKKDNVSRCLGQ